MHLSTILEVPDEAIWNIIMKDLNEDTEKLEKQVDFFQDWLIRDPYLPKNVDKHLIRNLIRHCEYNMENTQRKFEQILASRSKLKTYFINRDLNDEYFDDISLQRQMIPVPKYTPNGYRIIYARFLPDINHFDFRRLLHYAFLYIDFVLCEDSAAGYVGIYDLQHFKLEHMENVIPEVFAESINYIYNLEVCKIKSIHFLNTPIIPEKLLNTIMELTKPELESRTFMHENPAELLEHFPTDQVPKEYGGTGPNYDDFAETAKEYFIGNKALGRKVVSNLEYIDVAPKSELYLSELEPQREINLT